MNGLVALFLELFETLLLKQSHYTARGVPFHGVLDMACEMLLKVAVLRPAAAKGSPKSNPGAANLRAISRRVKSRES